MSDQIILITGETPSSAKHVAVVRMLDRHGMSIVVGEPMVIVAPPEITDFIAIEPSMSVQHGPRRKRGKGNKYHRS